METIIQDNHNVNYDLEDAIIDYLDEKRFSDLNRNWQIIIYKIFQKVDKRVKIKCYRPQYKNEKVDMIIELKDEKKYISIKDSRSEYLHREGIKDFVLFLRANGVSVRTQQTILLFHYGDGTMDGSGKKRYNWAEITQMLSERLKEANQELNDNKALVLKCFERFAFRGIEKEFDDVDYIYSGNVEEGTMCSRGEIEKYLLFKDYSKTITLHIGPASISPTVRYINSKVKNPQKRAIVSVKWSQMANDLHFISSSYTRRAISIEPTKTLTEEMRERNKEKYEKQIVDQKADKE